MSDPLVRIDEIIAKGDELIETASSGMVVDTLRGWYDQLYAERLARHNAIAIKDGSKITVGKLYDLTVELSRPGKTQVLRGYKVDSRGALWSDQVVNVHKPEPGREWAGPRRELMPYNILSAVEVEG